MNWIRESHQFTYQVGIVNIFQTSGKRPPVLPIFVLVYRPFISPQNRQCLTALNMKLHETEIQTNIYNLHTVQYIDSWTVQYSTVQYTDTLDTKSKYEINSCNYGWPGRARAQYPAIASQNKICSSCPPPIHEKSLAQSFMHGASKLFPRFLEQPPPTNQLPDYLNMFLY